MTPKKAARKKAAPKKAAHKKAAKQTPPEVGKQSESSLLPAGYGELLEDLKSRVRAAQLKAAVTVNRELIRLYWDIGRLIVERQATEGWGKSVVERLADDIQRAFPGLGGFSRSNVFRMRAFYEGYAASVPAASQAVPKSRGKKVAQAVRQLPAIT